MNLVLKMYAITVLSVHFGHISQPYQVYSVWNLWSPDIDKAFQEGYYTLENKWDFNYAKAMRINTQEAPIIYFFHSTLHLSTSKRACVRLQDKTNQAWLMFNSKCSPVQFWTKSISMINMLPQMLHEKNQKLKKQKQ